MYRLTDNLVEQVTADSAGEITTLVANARVLTATQTGTEVRVEHRRPDLPDDDTGEWDGRLEPINATATITLDDADAGTVDLVDGAATITLNVPAGDYTLTVAIPDVQPATLALKV